MFCVQNVSEIPSAVNINLFPKSGSKLKIGLLSLDENP